MISGFVINVGYVLATKILTPSNFNNYSIRYTVCRKDVEENFIRPFACLCLFFSGLLSLSIASSYKVTRGAVLFLFSFVAMGSTIYCLYHSVQMYDKAMENEAALYDCESHWDGDYYWYKENKCPGSIIQNSTDFCLKWKSGVWNDNDKSTTTCIPIQKKCDGFLDFVPPSSVWRFADHFNTTGHYPQYGATMMLGDELFCAQRYISVFISIFGAAGIAIILTVAIWVMTFDTIGFFGKVIAATLKQKFFSHVPLVSS